jgi:hypothetical protein
MVALTGTGGTLLGAAVLGAVGHSYAYPALSAMIIARTPAGHPAATLEGYGPMFVIAALVSVRTAVYFNALARDRCS